MDLERLRDLKIPKKQEERNKVLKDALATKNPLLIEFALSIGADPKEGGKTLLEYEVQQGNLEMVKKLVPTIKAGKTTAMWMAIQNDQIEIGEWLLKENTVMHISRDNTDKHMHTIVKLLKQMPEAKAKIEYGALLKTLFFDDGAESLRTLLETLKRNESKSVFEKMLVELADDTVDTSRVDCMEVMVQFGLNVAYVNTKYCQSKEMRKFMKEHGARID